MLGRLQEEESETVVAVGKKSAAGRWEATG